MSNLLKHPQLSKGPVPRKTVSSVPVEGLLVHASRDSYAIVDVAQGRIISFECYEAGYTPDESAFLAVFHSLMLCYKQYHAGPVYTVSHTACAWFLQGRCPGEDPLIRECNAWLAQHFGQFEFFLEAFLIHLKINLLNMAHDQFIAELKQEDLAKQALPAKMAVEFPVEIFNPRIQESLRAARDHMQVSLNYLCCSFLLAMASAMNRRYYMQTSRGYTVRLGMWLLLVGRSGDIKTSALQVFTDIFENRNEENIALWQEYNKTYELLEEEERKRAGKPAPPELWISSDSTTESVVEILCSQRPGLLVYHDEALRFAAGMDLYRQKGGSDFEFWLSSFNMGRLTKTRSGSKYSHVKRLFVNLVGTLQIGRLIKFFRSNEDLSGLFDRFCFCIDSPPAEKDRDAIPAPEALEALKDMIYQSIDEPFDQETRLLFTEQAEQAHLDWQAALADQMNNGMPEMERQSARKDEIFVFRFALLIHLINHHRENPLPITIAKESVLSAIALVDYFGKCRDLVRSHLQGQAGAVDYEDLQKNIQMLLDTEDKKGLATLVKEARKKSVPSSVLEKLTGKTRKTIYRWANPKY